MPGVAELVLHHRAGFGLSTGETVPAATAREMGQIDRVAVEETGASLLQMMEHAGRSLAEVVISALDGAASGGRVAVDALFGYGLAGRPRGEPARPSPG
ncbi:MAG TPA: hypothetical protein VE173_04825 [Longimicrobiales bacterium]|nr:hypothetical protein [Longimicrobiales bacterium]